MQTNCDTIGKHLTRIVYKVGFAFTPVETCRNETSLGSLDKRHYWGTHKYARQVTHIFMRRRKNFIARLILCEKNEFLVGIIQDGRPRGN